MSETRTEILGKLTLVLLASLRNAARNPWTSPFTAQLPATAQQHRFQQSARGRIATRCAHEDTHLAYRAARGITEVNAQQRRPFCDFYMKGHLSPNVAN